MRSSSGSFHLEITLHPNKHLSFLTLLLLQGIHTQLHIQMIVQDTYRYRSKCVCKYPGQVLGSYSDIFWCPSLLSIVSFCRTCGQVLLGSFNLQWSCGQVLGSCPLHRWRNDDFRLPAHSDNVFNRCCDYACYIALFFFLSVFVIKKNYD